MRFSLVLGSRSESGRSPPGVEDGGQAARKKDYLCVHKRIEAHFVADGGWGAMAGDDMGGFIEGIELFFDGLGNGFEATSP